MAHSFSAFAVGDSKSYRGKSPLLRLEHEPFGLPKTIGDWIHIPDFFPNDFEPEQVVHCSETLRVYGREQEYRILKPAVLPGGGAEPFESRLLRARREVLDNHQFGKGVYQGLRVLAWAAEEPFWLDLLTPEALQRADSVAELSGAEVAIILKRVAPSQTLLSAAQGTIKLGHPRINRIAETISAFHRTATHHASTQFLDDPDAVAAFHHRCRMRRLRRFSVAFGSYLDPFSRLAFGEVIAFLERFFAQNEGLIYQRAQQGLVIDSHGSLRADTILFDRMDEANSVLLIGRKPDLSGNRIADVLGDLASLVIDLEARDRTRLAHDLMQKYMELNQGVFNSALFRFHCAQQAIEASRRAFEDAESDALLPVDGTRYLALAFRYAMNISSPFVICISDSSQKCGSEIAYGLSQLLEVSILSEESVANEIPRYHELAPNTLEKLLCDVEEEVQEGRSVVLVWNFSREEEAYEVGRLARRHQLPLLFVDPHRAFSNSRGGASVLARIEQFPEFEGELFHLPLESSLPSAELALHVIQQMRSPEAHLPF